ncbi:hypothetical protein [Acetobacter cerevisiae]|uniref:hypothetical protein n=1 Tax=Acetobacter cerevisiae TaxID=178900 RepID=UPI0009EBF395|nr:hypothetical protein [Acetobacter cerevisiae]GBQ10422.1 hypothetical protein AA14362_2546 [Acetobacter cerevisiae DSM 14362]
MIENNHTPKEKEFFRRIAIECGYLITLGQDQRLIAVPKNMQRKFGERLTRVAASLRYATECLPHDLERELSKFLSPETLDQIRQEQSLTLLHRLKQIQLPDLKTEVLMKWKVEFETLDLPSRKENNCGQELPTPSRTETVVPGGGAVTEPGTHGRTDGGVRQ